MLRSFTILLLVPLLAVVLSACGRPFGDASASQGATSIDEEYGVRDIGNPLPDTGSPLTISFRRYQANEISFVSDAPQERIAGTIEKKMADDVEVGRIVVDPAAGIGRDGRYEIPVADMNTGIPTRDQHLQQENWLHEKEYPTISLANLRATRIEGTDTLYRLTGDFVLRGVSQPFSTVANVRYYESARPNGRVAPSQPHVVRVETQFSVDITEHGVSHQTIPQFVEEVWDVSVTVWGRITEGMPEAQ